MKHTPLVAIKPDSAGIVVHQGYGDSFIEIPMGAIVPTMEKMAKAFIEIKEGNNGTK